MDFVDAIIAFKLLHKAGLASRQKQKFCPHFLYPFNLKHLASQQRTTSICLSATELFEFFLQNDFRD